MLLKKMRFSLDDNLIIALPTSIPNTACVGIIQDFLKRILSVILLGYFFLDSCTKSSKNIVRNSSKNSSILERFLQDFFFKDSSRISPNFFHNIFQVFLLYFKEPFCDLFLIPQENIPRIYPRFHYKDFFKKSSKNYVEILVFNALFSISVNYMIHNNWMSLSKNSKNFQHLFLELLGILSRILLEVSTQVLILISQDMFWSNIWCFF